MLALYTVSTHNKMLVAGTGNKIEDFGVGFFTKYGDGGVDLSPIADLMKSEVYALAKELGVSQSIIDAPPVDGLWADNRTDEEQIGASYDEMEWAMNRLSSKYQVPSTKLSSRQKKVLEIFKRFNKMNEHKMKPIPVCVIPKSLRGRASRTKQSHQ
jgi:NAD+ synthase